MGVVKGATSTFGYSSYDSRTTPYLRGIGLLATQVHGLRYKVQGLGFGPRWQAVASLATQVGQWHKPENLNPKPCSSFSFLVR